MIISFSTGAALAGFFFTGLWVTLRHLSEFRHPGILIMTSLIIRFGIVLAGFYGIARLTGFEGILAAAAGFIAIRLLLVRRLETSLGDTSR